MYIRRRVRLNSSISSEAGISMSDGSFVASQSIKSDIENIIKNENAKHPLSDQVYSKNAQRKGGGDCQAHSCQIPGDF